jgi:hypothetical protein
VFLTITRMIVGTTATDAKLTNRTQEKLVKLVKKDGSMLRQGYPRVAKLALMEHQRCAHGKSFNRSCRTLRWLRTFSAVESATSSASSDRRLASSLCSERCFSLLVACTICVTVA